MLKIRKAIFLLFVLFALILNGRNAHATETKNLDVSAVVPPKSDSLVASLESDRSQGSKIYPGDETIFSIYYRSLVTISYPITIVASWDKGIISGNGGILEVYDYKLGSAVTADDGTVPIIDLVNRTITWSIPALSYSTNSLVVRFTLKAKSDLDASNDIEVFTHADINFAGIDLDRIDYHLYITKSQLSATSTPGPTQTPTPVPLSLPIKINSVKITKVGYRDAKMLVSINKSGNTTILYRKCEYHKFDRDLSSNYASKNHALIMIDLDPDTLYCFKIQATDPSNSEQTISEIFVLKTAKYNQFLEMTNTYLTWNNIPINSKNEVFLLPSGVSVGLHIELSSAENIRSIRGIFINTSTLGINNLISQPEGEVNFIEIDDSNFLAEILSPSRVGEYQLDVAVNGMSDSRSSLGIPYTFKVVSPLKVVDKSNNKPIENVFVFIERFEKSSGVYRAFNANLTMSDKFSSIFLPYYTNKDGNLNYVLPYGKYKFTFKAIGFRNERLDVNISPELISYPQVRLTPRFTVFSFFEYIFSSILLIFTIFSFNLTNYFSTQIFKSVLYFLQFLFFFMLFIPVLSKKIAYKYILKGKLIIEDVIDESIHMYLLIWTMLNFVVSIFIFFIHSPLEALPFFIIALITGSVTIKLFLRKEKNMYRI